MIDPYLSVIIPTFNRRKQLENCLNLLRKQSLAQNAYEVIVVNDGSTDDTEDFLNEVSGTWSQLTVIHKENEGQGIARNFGLTHTKGQITMFIGDDIYAAEDFLEQHSKFHKENPELEAACLGLTEWYPEITLNSFMKWLTHGGPQFAYHKLEPGKKAAFWFFYSSNISIKTELLLKQAFDPDFKGYGWEDIELGYRLEKEEGLKLIYSPNAIAYHDHFMEEESLKNRMIKIGENAHIFQKKCPKLKIIPSGFKRLALNIIGSIPSLVILGILRVLIPKIGRKLYWHAISKRYFMKGVKSV